MGNIWAKKSIGDLLEQSSETHNNFKRTLKRFDLITLGIGAIIGAGIFVLTGHAAANYAGPAIIISFLLAGVACLFAGLCYAEFASMIPVSGSAYSYAYATIGEFFAWIIGWDLILEYLFGASTVAVGWSAYVNSFLIDLGIHLPDVFVNAPFSYNTSTHQYFTTGAYINLPAMLIVLVMTSILIVGIKQSANFNNIMISIKISVILIFILFGIGYIDKQNWIPFIPENLGHFGEFGWSGIIKASGVLFFAYIGFDAIATASQEAINPQKDIPYSILGALFLCTIFYIFVALVLTGIVPFSLLNDPAPLAVAVNKAGTTLYWLRFPIKFGAIAGLSSVVLIMLMAQPRIFYAMSRDGLLPPFLGKVHSKFKTPYISTLFTGIFASIIAGLFPISLLGELVSIGTLFAFVIVCIGILILRYKQPNINRPFKTPFFPLIPILGALCSIGVMLSLPLDTWLRLIIWLIIGLIIYFFYGNKNSKLGNK